MFKDIDPEEYFKLLHPRPVVVVTSMCPNGRGNAMACAWVTPISEEPPILGIAVAKENYTCECIKFSKEYAVNILPADLYEKVWFFGSRSGRDVDKLRESGLKIGKAKVISAPIIEESLGIIEAKVSKEVEVGECILFLGDVVAAYVKEGCWGAYGWELTSTTLLLHGWGRLFLAIDARTRRLFAKTK